MSAIDSGSTQRAVSPASRSDATRMAQMATHHIAVVPAQTPCGLEWTAYPFGVHTRGFTTNADYRTAVDVCLDMLGCPRS